MGSEESLGGDVGLAEMRMLRWMTGVTKMDRNRN